MKQTVLVVAILMSLVWHSAGREILVTKPKDPVYQKYLILTVPEPKPMLKTGDRLAICGDSITEQKLYSRIIEDYLTMSTPQLAIEVRQYGWSGERASGFLRRMTNDCLRFEPTIATTCYGMNDHEYRPYEERIGMEYRENTQGIVRAFKANGVRVVHGAPGCVGKMPHWVKTASGTVEDLNLSLSVLRNIGVQVAADEGVGFADVFWTMLQAGFEGQRLYGTNYAIAGKDGVHPGWAGQVVMAYSFLRAFGLDGEIGNFSVDLKRHRMRSSAGHSVISEWEGEYELESVRYPFCVCVPATNPSPGYPVCGTADPRSDDSIQSAMALVPFQQELNRFMLVGRNAVAPNYRVTWGKESKVFTRAQILGGINLAEEFAENPFCEAFAKVDTCVAAKQAFETRQVKEVFHGAEGKAHMEAAVSKTEIERAPLARAIRQAFVPVRHTIRVFPEP